MPTATYTRVIQAPPEVVFAFVADAENNPAWHAHVVETRWVDEGPTGLGRRGRQSSRLWGRDWAFVAEVAEWEPPVHVAFQVVEGMRIHTTIDVRPSDGGACRVTLTVQTPRLPGPGRRRAREPPDEGRYPRPPERRLPAPARGPQGGREPLNPGLSSRERAQGTAP